MDKECEVRRIFFCSYFSLLQPLLFLSCPITIITHYTYIVVSRLTAGVSKGVMSNLGSWFSAAARNSWY